jgi:primosomal protein N' (replication factor Y) (superfamily II helicase)
VPSGSEVDRRGDRGLSGPAPKAPGAGSTEPLTLFGTGSARRADPVARPTHGGGRPEGRVVRVLPDEPAIDKTFDYVVPDRLAGPVAVGARIRIALGPRRVGGWIVEVDVEPAPGVTLRPVAKLSGHGPTPELIELARWAAWRWAGRPATFLRTASPERVVMHLPPSASSPSPAGSSPRRHAHQPDADITATDPWMASSSPADGAPRPDAEAATTDPWGASRRGSTTVRRLAPAADVASVVADVASPGNALVLCPNLRIVHRVARRLREAGVAVAVHPDDWARGAAGATVVGTRAAAWAPVGDLAAIVVVDEHDEAHAQEQAPTWNARDVAVERARRAGIPCVLMSPCPSLEALAAGHLVLPSRGEERGGWPIVDVVDRRDDDPRTGLISERLVTVLRDRARRVVCILNRTGRARLLACAACGELARCETCDAAMTQPERGTLTCPRCASSRPVVCAACGGTRLKLLRQGVSRVREELEALVGEPVAEVSSTSSSTSSGASEEDRPAASARVVVGTEAALHQVGRADVVAFLDLDQELLAPRYRAAEQALALVVRAARLVGGKRDGGRLLLQTRVPHHEVVLAALHGDPDRVTQAERERREMLRFPPVTAMAEVSGAAAEAFVDALGHPPAVEVLGPADDRWLLRAPDHETLSDALAAAPRPPGRLRLAVDPLRV